MKTNVKCPNCKQSFPLDEVLLKDFKTSIEKDFQKELLRRQSQFSDELEKSRLEIREQVQEESNLNLRTKEKLILDLKNQLSKVKQKLENSSQQMTGEIQELELEAILSSEFPTHTHSLEPIGKGKNGADCILRVKVKNDIEIGSILFESKRVSTFNEHWIDKLKDDNLKSKCSAMVIVVSTMPKDAKGKFILRRGVWVCSFDREAIRQLTLVLSFGLLKVYEMKSFHSVSEEKARKLIEYLSSVDYENQVERVQAGFKMLDDSLQQQKNTLNKLLKVQEQQLQDTLTSTLEIIHSTDAIVRPTVAENQSPDSYKQAS